MYKIISENSGLLDENIESQKEAIVKSELLYKKSDYVDVLYVICDCTKENHIVYKKGER